MKPILRRLCFRAVRFEISPGPRGMIPSKSLPALPLQFTVAKKISVWANT